MADDTSATILTLHQPRRPKTAAERAKAYRQRQKDKLGQMTQLPVPVPAIQNVTQIGPTHSADVCRSVPDLIITPPSRSRHVAPVLLNVSALALAGIGITINGWFARSLGSTDLAGWLFLAIGIAADAVALAMPSCAAGLWTTGQRSSALVGWAVWSMTFAFALIASIGFAAVNIADVTASRAARVTPAVTAAQTALNDAMTARDRECKGGVGKFCRQREDAVTEARQNLNRAMHEVVADADPQTDAAIRVVSWASFGTLRPDSNDFAMVRLILLALLPQIGGIVLMVGRRA